MIEFDIRAAGRSEPGLVRSHNEDSMLLGDEQGFWLVFDGMGGHEHGALASQTAAKSFDGFDLPDTFEDAVTTAADRMHETNARLAQVAMENGGATMGTTAIGLLLRDRRFAVIWVGDSRAYLVRRGGLFQLSVDHTHVQDLIDQGILSPDDAKGHPMGHVLTRALGVADEISVDITQDEMEPGDRFLLCSDGLSGPVADADIRDILRSSSPKDAVDALIDKAYQNGAPDNVTAVVIEVGGAQQ